MNFNETEITQAEFKKNVWKKFKVPKRFSWTEKAFRKTILVPKERGVQWLIFWVQNLKIKRKAIKCKHLNQISHLSRLSRDCLDAARLVWSKSFA